MMINVQNALPAECQKAFAANSELTGQPSIGRNGIHGTGSVQVNISAAGLFLGGKCIPSRVLRGVAH